MIFTAKMMTKNFKSFLLISSLTALVSIDRAFAEPTAKDMLSLTETCKTLLSVGKFKTDAQSRTASAQICQLKGAIWFKADMDIDCDGGSTATCKADRSYQPETSCTTSRGKPLDAAKLPFIVLPQDSNGWKASDYKIGCGTVAAVIYNGKIEFGILGDRGPKGVVGEASYAMAERLGINSDPNRGGTSSGVTYIVFTGANVVVKPTENYDRAVEIGKRLATELIAQNNVSDNISTVKFQKPSQGQILFANQPVTLEGTAASDVTKVKLIADGKWELASVSVNQETWSATYRFLERGNRQLTVLGFDAFGKQIAADNINIRVRVDR